MKQTKGQDSKVQVLTAGGAAATTSSSTKKKTTTAGKKKKKKNVPPSSSVEQPASGGVKDSEQQHAENQSDFVNLEIEEDNKGHHSPEQSQQQKAGNGSLDLSGRAPYSDDAGVAGGGKSAAAGGGGGGADGTAKPVELFPSPGAATAASTVVDDSTTISKKSELVWLFICFLGIMASFVCYGLLLEYTTSGGRKLHELSFLFVTSGLYTLTAAAGRYVRDETPTTIPPARFAVLGLTSMGSTFCSVRSLRYVIYPIQVLAKSCKPVPVMIMGALMGKKYPLRKYLNVVMIVVGVALFMGGGDKNKKHAADDEEKTGASQMIGILLLFVSLCFDGGTGAYEDKLMSVHSVQPFDLMYNIQLGKTILAFIGLVVLNQLHIFIQMVQDMGFLLVALGLSGALGQVFIFVTIAKFGALTCSIIGLARKVTTLVASIYFYGHHLNSVQFTGLVVSVGAMVMNFWGKKNKGGGGGGGHGHGQTPAKQVETSSEELEKMLDEYRPDEERPENKGDDHKEDDMAFAQSAQSKGDTTTITAGGTSAKH